MKNDKLLLWIAYDAAIDAVEEHLSEKNSRVLDDETWTYLCHLRVTIVTNKPPHMEHDADGHCRCGHANPRPQVYR